MKLIQLSQKLAALLDHKAAEIEKPLDIEVVCRLPSGEILRINNAVFQPDAQEIQLFVAPQ